METTMKITAICGWALPEEWFRQLVKSYFPKAEVRACYPKKPENIEEATEILNSESDWVIGYSLGSLWLLVHKKIIPLHTKMVLMAPILAFPAEKNLGGKTPLGKLKYQKKMLGSSEDYLSSLKGFFDLSGIRLPENDLQQPYSREVLIRGLDFLETASVSPETTRDCIAITGLRDPLLDGNQLKELIPHLTVVKDCDHSPHKLLSHLAQHHEGSDKSSPQISQSIFPQRAL
jgi:hypothetical protein